jgi:8-oxo-dGTP pyrophosphatase MutT (NUDIX family)
MNCSNCGLSGHSYKSCSAPVSSYGLIAFRAVGEPQVDRLIRETKSLTGYEGQKIQFLLIQRKDSIGYVEIIRGKYKLDDTAYIQAQATGMTASERERVLTLPFETLWTDMWGSNSNGKQFTNEFEQSRRRFNTMKESGQLAKLMTDAPAPFNTPEWGFPKGRRNPREDNIACAMREFNEETGLRPNQYKVIENMEPIRETFFGNNHIHYTHVYYLAFCCDTLEVKMNPDDVNMARETGDIRWASLEEALTLIRPENVEKREILLRASSILRNYCALQMGTNVGFYGGSASNQNPPRFSKQYNSSNK